MKREIWIWMVSPLFVRNTARLSQMLRFRACSSLLCRREEELCLIMSLRRISNGRFQLAILRLKAFRELEPGCKFKALTESRHSRFSAITRPSFPKENSI